MSDPTAATLHPMAPAHLPGFLPDATGHDPMLIHMVLFVSVLVFILITLFLRLHSLPEQLAHKVGATQLQIVGILGLIALFTHNNLYWVAALLLAVIQIPDYQTPLDRIADAVSGRTSPHPEPDSAAKSHDAAPAQKSEEA
ncbi:hypothetical protein [Shimia sp. SDUM112013]|uniref:hypothetical protein n=1 Tax=Shimia sp. SDUM112013 TaxID=3136160 RepID=UPI0032EC80A6